MFFLKSDIKKKAGMHHTESQSGDAPKPSFSIKTHKKYEKSGNLSQINHRNWSLFLSLNLPWWFGFETRAACGCRGDVGVLQKVGGLEKMQTASNQTQK